MKKIICFITIFCSILVFSQKSNPKKILDETNKQLSKHNTFHIKFDYNFVNDDKKINNKDIGEIYSSGDKYNLILNDLSQIFDGEKVYTINDSDKEITISDKEDAELVSPTSILNMYKDGYDISDKGSKVVNGKKCNVIELTPTKRDNVKSIQVMIANKEIIQVIQNYKDGSYLNLTVKEFMKNILISRYLFVFSRERYSDYIITEL